MGPASRAKSLEAVTYRGRMQRRGWLVVLVVSTALALVSMVSNLTTEAQLSGQADTVLAVRFTISKLVNTGTVWAGLGILAGRLVRRTGQAVVAGLTALLLALVVHYGLGLLVGMFEADVWVNNSYWFLAAVVAGGPLGLIGATARRTDGRGLVARLVVPVAAIVEPFVVGMFDRPDFIPWPDRTSSVVVGVTLLIGGLTALIAVIVRWVRDRRAAESKVLTGAHL